MVNLYEAVTWLIREDDCLIEVWLYFIQKHT